MPYYSVNSFLVDELGVLQVGVPPIAGYNGGLPFDSEGRLIIQMNQTIGLADSFVGGARVGPFGGVYALDPVNSYT